MCKYTDDAYVITPAANERSPSSALDHIQHWAKINNLGPDFQKILWQTYENLIKKSDLRKT